MSRRSRAGTSAAMLALFVGAACGESAADGGIDPPPETWSVGPEPVVSIGQTQGDAAYLFTRVAGVRLLPDHRIVVADRGSSTLRIYGPDGGFEREMGGEGEGPGEFRYLSHLRVTPPDTIEAYDSDLYRLTRFLVTGALVSTLQMEPETGFPEMYMGTFRNGQHAVAWIDQVAVREGVITPDEMVLGRFDADGRAVDAFARMPGMRRLRSPLPFSPHLVTAKIGDTVYYTDGLGGTLRAADPVAGLAWEVPVPTPARDPEAAFAELAGKLAAADARRLEEVRQVRGTDTIPAFADMLAAPDARLWLKRYRPATDSHWLGRPRNGGEWLVVEPGGDVIAGVTLPADFRLMDVRGGRLAGVARDELGVERVQVYALVAGGMR